MLRFVLRRLLLVIPSLAGLLVMTFFLIRVVPADPAAALAGDNATPAQVAEIRRQYGLDQPLYVQFAVYLTPPFITTDGPTRCCASSPSAASPLPPSGSPSSCSCCSPWSWTGCPCVAG